MDGLEERYKIARLIAGKITGELSKKGAECLENWRQASPENEEEFGRIVQRLKTDLPKKPELNKEREWKFFERKISMKRRIFRRGYSVAAVLAGIGLIIAPLLLRQGEPSPQVVQTNAMNNVKAHRAILILDDGEQVNITDTTDNILALAQGTKIETSGNVLKYNTMNPEKEEEIKYNTLVVPRGGEYELLLEDGTKVWLNSDSKLVYPVRFTGAVREVQMEGEICFEVAKNEKQPFIVKTKEVSVKVLGTRFNIEAYRDDKYVTTTLVEGRVDVSDARQNRVITPDQQAIVGNHEFVVKKVDARAVVSWTDGVCCFRETALEDIMEKLARWYDVEVFFTNLSVRNIHFSLEIERYDNIAEVLSKIEKTGRVKFRVNGGMVMVYE